MTEDKSNKTHPISKLLSYSKKYKSDFKLAALFSILNKFFDILPEILIGVAVDVVINGDKSFLAKQVLSGIGISDTWHQLLFLGALNIVIWGCESLFEYLLCIKWRNLAQNLQHEVRLDIYRHVQQLDMAYFENQKTGNLMSILNDDINQMERFLNGGANQIIQVFCSTIMVSAVFFVIQPSLAIISLLPIPFILFGAFWFQKKLAPKYAKVREAAGDLNARLNNNLLGVATIKAYATENFEIEKMVVDSTAYRQANSNAIKINSAITPVIRMAILAGFTATLVYGGYLTIHQQLSIGAYSVLVFLTQRLLWPLTALADVADMYQRSMAAIDRAMNLLNTPIQITYEGKNLIPQNVKGELKIQDVSFYYENKAVALKNINLNIPAGKTIAFVGTTGSGKSTLVKLLLRFYSPQQGKILLDNVPISDLNLQDLRRAIGYVAQDTFLTDGTIAENIAYGQNNVSAEALKQAAITAEAYEFIQKLPQGFDTRVGERGQKLSGGQRQRIALARAILKNPPIFILDEATSAIDNETEDAIRHSLEVISKNRTTILIAHRLSTIRQADCIYVLENHEITESGTHDELIKLNGIYASLWLLQTGETK